MVSVRLRPDGELIEYLLVTPRERRVTAEFTEPDWSAAFVAAGLSYDDFKDHPREPQWSPPTHADVVRGWRFESADKPAITVDAAGYQGRLVYFQVKAPWTIGQHTVGRTTRLYQTGRRGRNVTSRSIREITFLMVLFLSVILALRNLRLMRVDLTGAWKLALFIFCVHMVAGLLRAHFSVDLVRLLDLFGEILVKSSARTFRLWVYYVALEPFVRRYWPNSLITWNRLLSGRFRDVRVGRDVLVGWVAAAVLMATQFSAYHALVGQGASDPGASAFPMNVETLMGARFGMSTLLGSALSATTGTIYLLLTLFLFRLTLRNKWLAVVAFTLLWTTLYCIDTGSITVWLMSGLCVACGIHSRLSQCQWSLSPFCQ